ncbi:hypothetical protein VRB80_13265 [Erwinia aphidicola]|uniref:hypothetical protein n=1 Tax=Erwinia aphidicola TaxID=68334 RepID=UPI0030CFCDB5
MVFTSETLKKLANKGVNLDIGPHYTAATLTAVVNIVVEKGAHITVDATKITSSTAISLAEIGGKHLTLKF